MDEIKIENLIPSSSSFKLEMFKGFEFKLNPCTGGMLVDMSRKIGDIEKLLSIPSAENISKIAIMLMEFDSAVKFKKQKVKTIDVMTGDENEVEIGGYTLLMHSIQGVNEQCAMYAAVLISLGYSKKNADKVIKKLKDGINKVINNEVDKLSKKKMKKKT